MDENAAAYKSSSSSSDGGIQEHHQCQRESSSGVDDDIRIHSILEAAIGLTSLGEVLPEERPRQKKKKVVSASFYIQGVNTTSAAASAVVGKQQMESTKKKPKAAMTSLPDKRRTKQVTIPAAAATTQLAPLSPGNDQQPRIVPQKQKDLRSGKSGGVQMHPFDHDTTTIQATSSIPHLFPKTPNPLKTISALGEPGAELHPHSKNNTRTHSKLDVPTLKCQRFHRRPRTTLSELQSKTPPAENADDVPITSISTVKAGKTEPTAGAAISITLNFPEILYEIISDPANYKIISWLPHGKGFVVHDRQLFASEILTRHFDGAKYTSFTRRLKRWKFERVARGPEMGAYYGKSFVRDRPDLVSSMVYVSEGGKELNETDIKNKKKREKNKEPQLARGVKSFGDASDNSAVKTVAEVELCHQVPEQQQSDSEGGRQQQLLRRQLKRDFNGGANICDDAVERAQSEKKGKDATEAQATTLDTNIMAKVTAKIHRQVAAQIAQAERQKESEVGTVSGPSYDNAMLNATMEVHQQNLGLELLQHQRSKESKNSFQEMNPNRSHKETSDLQDKIRSIPPSPRCSSVAKAASLQLEINPQLPNDSENNYQEKKSSSSRQGSIPETTPVLYNRWEHIFTGMQSSSRDSSSSETPPTPINPSYACDLPDETLMAHHLHNVHTLQQQEQSVLLQRIHSIDRSVSRHLNDCRARQQHHQLMLLQRNTSSNLPAGLTQRQCQKSTNGRSQTSQTGYHDRATLRRKRKHPQQGTQPQQQQPYSSIEFESLNTPANIRRRILPSHTQRIPVARRSMLASSSLSLADDMLQNHILASSSLANSMGIARHKIGDLQRHSLSTQYVPKTCNTNDHRLSMTMTHRNMLDSSSLTENMAIARHSNIIPDTMTSVDRSDVLLPTMDRRSKNIPGATDFLGRNALISQHLHNFIAHPDIDIVKQQCHLEDLEQSLFSEISHPMLHAISSPDPLSTRSYLRNLRNNLDGNFHEDPHSTNSHLRSNAVEDRWVNYYRERMNEPMSNQESVLDRFLTETRNNTDTRDTMFRELEAKVKKGTSAVNTADVAVGSCEEREYGKSPSAERRNGRTSAA